MYKDDMIWWGRFRSRKTAKHAIAMAAAWFSVIQVVQLVRLLSSQLYGAAGASMLIGVVVLWLFLSEGVIPARILIAICGLAVAALFAVVVSAVLEILGLPYNIVQFDPHFVLGREIQPLAVWMVSLLAALRGHAAATFLSAPLKQDVAAEFD